MRQPLFFWLVTFVSAIQLATADDFANVLDGVKPSIVTIQTGTGLGSGFVVAKDMVATNYHVIQDANNVVVKFRDGTILPSHGMLFADNKLDIAILKVELNNRGPQPLTLLGGTAKQGWDVAALGHPEGLDLSVTRGIVSAVRNANAINTLFRDQGIENGKPLAGDWIQTDAAISPGNSGGPLIRMDGTVVGMNTWGLTKGQNLNFAISSANIAASLTQAERKGFPEAFPNLNTKPPVDLAGQPLAVQVQILTDRVAELKTDLAKKQQSLNNFGATYEQRLKLHPSYAAYVDAMAKSAALRSRGAQIEQEVVVINRQQAATELEAQAIMRGLQQQEFSELAQLENNLQLRLNNSPETDWAFYRSTYTAERQTILIRYENLRSEARQRYRVLLDQRQQRIYKLQDEAKSVLYEIQKIMALPQPFLDFQAQLDAEGANITKAIQEDERSLKYAKNKLRGLTRKLKFANRPPEERGTALERAAAHELKAEEHLQTVLKLLPDQHTQASAQIEQFINEFPDTSAAKVAKSVLAIRVPRKWSSNRGNYQLTASYVSHNSSEIVLQKKGGQQSKVERSKLSLEDRRLLDRLGDFELYTNPWLP